MQPRAFRLRATILNVCALQRELETNRQCGLEKAAADVRSRVAEVDRAWREGRCRSRRRRSALPPKTRPATSVTRRHQLVHSGGFAWKYGVHVGD
jgi:hypothetical protein